MRKHIPTLIPILSFCMLSGTASAALIDRGGGLIYDTELDITWLADTNYAHTSGFDDDGRMTWHEALDWADNLSYYDSVRDVTYSDWRLPKTKVHVGEDGRTLLSTGFNHRDSELGHLYYIDFSGKPTGAEGGFAITDPDVNLFINFPPTPGSYEAYWSETVASHSLGYAYLFEMAGVDQGRQAERSMDADFIRAWAVRDGDVVPVPAAVWLFGSGLIALFAGARRMHTAKSAST